jgi:DUF971 family protein
MAVRPTEARRLPEQRRLRLVWDDGHAGEYAYQELRGWCPCALCQGHDALDIVYHPPAGPVDLVALDQVGNYALSFVWSDGHRSGIYRFDFLRGLCPCPLCRPGGRTPTA